MSLLIDGPEANIFCHFRLALLIEEGEGVVARVASIKEGPSDAWMSRVVKLSTKRGIKLNWG